MTGKEVNLYYYMEFSTNLCNNKPNAVIDVGVATAVLLGDLYIFIRYN